MNLQQYIIPALGVAIVLVGGAFFSWFKIVKETNNLLRDQNKELKISIAALETKYQESTRVLASMQGQIDTLKSIPLANIDSILTKLSKSNASLVISNNHILETLQKSAHNLSDEKHDGGLLVKTQDAKPLDVKPVKE